MHLILLGAFFYLHLAMTFEEKLKTVDAELDEYYGIRDYGINVYSKRIYALRHMVYHRKTPGRASIVPGYVPGYHLLNPATNITKEGEVMTMCGIKGYITCVSGNIIDSDYNLDDFEISASRISCPHCVRAAAIIKKSTSVPHITYNKNEEFFEFRRRYQENIFESPFVYAEDLDGLSIMKSMSEALRSLCAKYKWKSSAQMTRAIKAITAYEAWSQLIKNREYHEED